MYMMQLHYNYQNNEFQIQCEHRPATLANQSARAEGSQDQS